MKTRGSANGYAAVKGALIYYDVGERGQEESSYLGFNSNSDSTSPFDTHRTDLVHGIDVSIGNRLCKNYGYKQGRLMVRRQCTCY